MVDEDSDADAAAATLPAAKKIRTQGAWTRAVKIYIVDPPVNPREVQQDIQKRDRDMHGWVAHSLAL